MVHLFVGGSGPIVPVIYSLGTKGFKGFKNKNSHFTDYFVYKYYRQRDVCSRSKIPETDSNPHRT